MNRALWLTENPNYLLQVVTLLLAIIAALIAYQQSQTSRLKLKFELYEKRLVQFNALMALLGIVAREGKIDLPELFTFVEKTRDSYFLFGEQISDYLTEVYKNGIDLRTINQQLHHSNLPIGDERNRLAEKDGELLKWFNRQFEVSRKKFSAHLSLKSLV